MRQPVQDIRLYSFGLHVWHPCPWGRLTALWHIIPESNDSTVKYSLLGSLKDVLSMLEFSGRVGCGMKHLGGPHLG